MRCLIIDTDACGLDMAWRAAEAGHEVRWYLPPVDGKPPRDGDGFDGIQKVRSWKDSMSWARSGIVINLFNDRQVTAELDRFREFGFPVFGPSVKSAALEWDRARGLKFFRDHGIEIPKYHEFRSLDEALAFAWKAQDPYVFKLMGDAEDKATSYVASDPADLVGWLEAKRSQGMKVKGSCILQEKIDLVAEVGVSGWLGKAGFLPGKWNINFEFKKLLDNDEGPSTGETGTCIRYVEESLLADTVLRPLEESLVELGHIGDFDVNCGIDAQGRAWPFEPTARDGWPYRLIVNQCHDGDPIQWMKDALDGVDSLAVDRQVAVGVGLFRAPFPNANEHPEESVGFLVQGLDEIWDKVSPWQLMIEEGPVMKEGAPQKGRVFKTTGEYVCVVTGLGGDVHDAITNAYAAVDSVKFSDRIVRRDIGKRLEKQLPKLKALGYDEVPDF